MNGIDYFVMALYALMIVMTTLWAMRRVGNTRDFFAAGGKMPCVHSCTGLCANLPS